MGQLAMSFNILQDKPTVHITDGYAGGHWLVYERYHLRHKWVLRRWELQPNGSMKQVRVFASKSLQKAFERGVEEEEKKWEGAETYKDWYRKNYIERGT